MIVATMQRYVLMGGVAVVAALLVMCGLMYVQNGALKNDLATEKLEVTRLTGERDSSVATANKNAESFHLAMDELSKTQSILDSVRETDAARQDKIITITKEVSRAKKSNCPAGDGLAAAHRGLLELTKGKAGN